MNKIFELIWNSNFNSNEKLILAILWTFLFEYGSYSEEKKVIVISKSELAQSSSLNNNKSGRIITDLDNSNWLILHEIISDDFVEKLKIELLIPNDAGISLSDKELNYNRNKKEEDNTEQDYTYNGHDAMGIIISFWRKHFQKRPMTPTEYTYLKGFIDKGMEARLIAELLGYAKSQGINNPISYIKKILTDLYNNEIFTLNQYLENDGEMKNIGEKSISEINSRKEKANRKDKISELEEKGWD
ncbi:MAG: DnaD domain protein [Bacillota bacterium]